MAVLPRPMSSARQPPRPRRSRNRSQPRPRRWYGRSSPTNPAGSCSSREALVGQPGRAARRSTPRRWRPRRSASSSPSPASRSSVDGIDRGVVADVVLEPLAGPGAARPGRCAPSAGRCAAAWRRPRSARSSSASEIAAGPSSSATTRRHVDDGLAPEPLAVVGRRRRRRRPAAHADAGAHQPLRTDELDAARGELGRRLLEEPLGRPRRASSRPARLVLGGQLGGDLDAPGDRRGEALISAARRVRCVAPAGHLDGHGGGVPDVLGRAPAPGVELVDELEAHLPVVVGIVGHDEPHAGQHDGLAAQAPLVALEARRQRGELRRGGRGAAADRGVGSTTARGARSAPPPSPGPGGSDSGARQSRSARRWRASGSTIAAWMSATGRGIAPAASARRSAASPPARSASGLGGTSVGDGDPPGDRHVPVVAQIAGATSPAPTVAAARRATAASQASESRDVCSPTSSGAQPAGRAVGRQAHRRRADRLAVGDRHVERREVADQERVGRRSPLRRAKARCSALGSAVWAPSHPHRCRPPCRVNSSVAGAAAADLVRFGARRAATGHGSEPMAGCHQWRPHAPGRGSNRASEQVLTRTDAGGRGLLLVALDGVGWRTWASSGS